MENSALGNFGKRALAWVVLIVVAVFALKLLVGFVAGLVTMAVIVLAIVALLWALRHL